MTRPKRFRDMGLSDEPEGSVKERPILFSAPMVRAIRSGAKTQTRRVVNPQPINRIHWDSTMDCAMVEDHWGNPIATQACPYGKKDDRLWVRETHGNIASPGNPPAWVYRADGELMTEPSGFKWRPPIHMSRAVSRLTLEISRVRVERLHNISESDAQAEGARELPLQESQVGAWWTMHPVAGAALHARSAVEALQKYWCHLNGTESWESNPWVWVVEFDLAGFRRPF